MYDLSILIPARNEEFLRHTIQDILKNIEGETEIIAVLDGYWPEPGIPDDDRVTLIHPSEPVGQRAAVNEAVKFSEAKYIMKVDAHCSFDKGFDVKLMEVCQPDWTVVPRMYPLHIFDWKCTKCDLKFYQDKEPVCPKCGGEVGKEIVWKKRSRAIDYMWFNEELKFSYFDNNYLKPFNADKETYHHKNREWAKGEVTDQMMCIGACWMMERERYWALGGLDEGHGGWGQMGIEIACKTWLSGGRQVVHKGTWFAHLFRTSSHLKFPFPLSKSQTDKARAYSRDLWLNGKWPKAIYSLEWLFNKFKPLPGLKDIHAPSAESPTKGIVYYTDNRASERILKVVRNQLETIGLPIVSVSLLPIRFGSNIVLNEERGPLTMFKQILAGLEASDADIIYMCEHDVLYHPSHFEFEPPRADVYYYNYNMWKVDEADGKALHYRCGQTSGLVAYRILLLEHYRKRVAIVEKEGYNRNMGFEPGYHNPPRGVDSYKWEEFWSAFPIIDIRHKHNLTRSRWRQDQFRSQKNCQGWVMADEVLGWGVTKNRFDEFLRGIDYGN